MDRARAVALWKQIEPTLAVRGAALLAAVVLHLSLLLLEGRQFGDDRTADSAMQLRFLDDTRPRPVLLEEQPTESGQDTTPAAPPVPARQEIPVATGISTAQPAQPAEPIDWQSAGTASATAAVSAIIREEAYRPLGPREKTKLLEPETPSIYEKPKHKLGDIDDDALGNTSVWHNDNCYTRLEEPVSERPNADIPGVNLMRCMWKGRRKARGDLFEHLRKTLPEPKITGESAVLPERLPENE